VIGQIPNVTNLPSFDNGFARELQRLEAMKRLLEAATARHYTMILKNDAVVARAEGSLHIPRQGLAPGRFIRGKPHFSAHRPGFVEEAGV
jgi:hypothetical protein